MTIRIDDFGIDFSDSIARKLQRQRRIEELANRLETVIKDINLNADSDKGRPYLDKRDVCIGIKISLQKVF